MSNENEWTGVSLLGRVGKVTPDAAFVRVDSLKVFRVADDRKPEEIDLSGYPQDLYLPRHVWGEVIPAVGMVLVLDDIKPAPDRKGQLTAGVIQGEAFKDRRPEILELLPGEPTDDESELLLDKAEEYLRFQEALEIVRCDDPFAGWSADEGAKQGVLQGNRQVSGFLRDRFPLLYSDEVPDLSGRDDDVRHTVEEYAESLSAIGMPDQASALLNELERYLGLREPLSWINTEFGESSQRALVARGVVDALLEAVLSAQDSRSASWTVDRFRNGLESMSGINDSVGGVRVLPGNTLVPLMLAMPAWYLVGGKRVTHDERDSSPYYFRLLCEVLGLTESSPFLRQHRWVSLFNAHMHRIGDLPSGVLPSPEAVRIIRGAEETFSLIVVISGYRSKALEMWNSIVQIGEDAETQIPDDPGPSHILAFMEGVPCIFHLGHFFSRDDDCLEGGLDEQLAHTMCFLDEQSSELARTDAATDRWPGFGDHTTSRGKSGKNADRFLQEVKTRFFNNGLSGLLDWFQTPVHDVPEEPEPGPGPFVRVEADADAAEEPTEPYRRPGWVPTSEPSKP